MERKIIRLVNILTFTILSTCFALANETILTVWAMGAEGRKLPEMAKRFEQENPGVKVVVQPIPWGAAHEKLLTAVVGGIPPDVCQLGTTWMSEFYAMEALEPLDEFIQNSKVISKEKYFSGSWNTCVFNGKVYGIPWYVDTRILFYRTDLLKSVGYDHPPRTWDELIDAGKKLTKDLNNDGRIDRWAINLPSGGSGIWTELGFFVWQNDAEFLTEDNKKSLVLTPKFVEAVKFYYDIFNKHKIAPIGAQADIDIFHAFRTGYFCMFVSGPWMIELVSKECAEIEGRWFVSPLWTKDKKSKKYTSFVGGCNLVIFKKSQRKDVAWKFIEFMSRPENQVEWYKLTTDLPAIRSAWYHKYFDDKPMMKAFLKQLEDAKGPPNIPEWEQIAYVIGQKMELIIRENAPIEDTLRILDKEINTILEKYIKPSRIGILLLIGLIMLFVIIFLIFLRKPAAETSFGRSSNIAYLFILPAVCILVVFLFIPIIASFMLSLTNYDIYSIANPQKLVFIGIENYKLLVKDPVFWKSLRNTFLYVFLGVPLNIFIALIVALILNEKFIKLRSFFRAGYFMPVITSLVAVAVIWKWLYDPNFGLINSIITLIGLEPQDWLNSTRLALPSLILMATWKNFGYNMVIFLAGLQAIPESLYEAAAVDGANKGQIVWHITLPGLKPTTLFITITSVIGYFQFFAEPYIMTQGGPMNSTISVVLYMYNQGFKFFKLGFSSATAYVLFSIIFVFTLVQLRFQKTKFY
ncbi:MAG: extracellular solute-binding protein [Endomicrobia bacterium]|nr:extracellular solute-binding protein [Endomicrobiia bacterium]MDW8055791.1 extracellular solute-binding protein [Elusimicrobiota bacterium]